MFFMTIDKAKFRKPALPGDTIEYHVEKTAHRRNMWWYQCEAKVDGALIAEAVLGAYVAEEEMARIDPTARVADGARMGEDVEIGPYCIVGPDVALGRGVRLIANVHITGVTTLGEGTVVYPFASLGTPPQSVHYRGGATRLVVGAHCELREDVTMNTGTEAGGGETRVGERCLFMVGSHVGHDCRVGNRVTFANNVTCSAVTSASAITWCSAVSPPSINSAASAKAPWWAD